MLGLPSRAKGGDEDDELDDAVAGTANADKIRTNRPIRRNETQRKHSLRSVRVQTWRAVDRAALHV